MYNYVCATYALTTIIGCASGKVTGGPKKTMIVRYGDSRIILRKFTDSSQVYQKTDYIKHY